MTFVLCYLLLKPDAPGYCTSQANDQHLLAAIRSGAEAVRGRATSKVFLYDIQQPEPRKDSPWMHMASIYYIYHVEGSTSSARSPEATMTFKLTPASSSYCSLQISFPRLSLKAAVIDILASTIPELLRDKNLDVINQGGFKGLHAERANWRGLLLSIL
jgi:hypothetical protein